MKCFDTENHVWYPTHQWQCGLCQRCGCKQPGISDDERRKMAGQHETRTQREVRISEVLPSLLRYAGTGIWDQEAGHIQDCTADLGEPVYDALEAALHSGGFAEVEVDGRIWQAELR